MWTDANPLRTSLLAHGSSLAVSPGVPSEWGCRYGRRGRLQKGASPLKGAAQLARHPGQGGHHVRADWARELGELVVASGCGAGSLLTAFLNATLRGGDSRRAFGDPSEQSESQSPRGLNMRTEGPD